MPEFIIEVTSKRTFGPYTYPTAAKLRNAIVAGKRIEKHHNKSYHVPRGSTLRVPTHREPAI
jgi:hypothetical protein